MPLAAQSIDSGADRERPSDLLRARIRRSMQAELQRRPRAGVRRWWVGGAAAVAAAAAALAARSPAVVVVVVVQHTAAAPDAPSPSSRARSIQRCAARRGRLGARRGGG